MSYGFAEPGRQRDDGPPERSHSNLLALGDIVATPAILNALASDRDAAVDLIGQTILPRLTQRDWGDISADDRTANNEALVNGDRIVAAYTITSLLDQSEVRVLAIREIIDDLGTPRTTLMLPDDY